MLVGESSSRMKWWLGNWRIITEDEVLAGAIAQGGEGAFDLVQVVGGCDDLVTILWLARL